jgi:hypothetical protein
MNHSSLMPSHLFNLEVGYSALAAVDILENSCC